MLPGVVTAMLLAEHALRFHKQVTGLHVELGSEPDQIATPRAAQRIDKSLDAGLSPKLPKGPYSQRPRAKVKRDNFHSP